MTSYKAIEYLIVSGAITLSTAREVIFDAYYYDRIDGNEYEELRSLADHKCIHE